MNFPRSAVICTPTYEEAVTLCDFLNANGFHDGHDDEGEIDPNEWNGLEDNTCFDIDGEAVFSASRDYYEGRFKTDYPELIPDDPAWFLCTVEDFIAMCSDETINAEFEIGEESDLMAMLGG